MQGLKLYKESHIYLFENRSEPGHPQLKNIINFLKWKNLKQIVKFDHIPEDGNLIEDLTLHDNLTLSSKEFCRYRKLPKNINDLLVKNLGGNVAPLINEITNWNLYPEDVTPKVRKIVSLLKGINLSHPYVVLEKPEKHLPERIISHLKVLILDLVESNKSEVIISNSKQDGPWENMFNKRIIYETNKLFRIEDFVINNGNQIVDNSINEDDDKLAA